MTIGNGCGISAWAAILATVLGLAFTSPAAAVDQLEMFIQNTSNTNIFFDTQVAVSSYPNTIEAQTTSDPIEAKSTRDTTKGQITYMNNANSANATCTVTLSYTYKWNGDTRHCDNKGFTMTNTGPCHLTWVPTCSGDGACKCNFTFTAE
jgi:hypothetical protein